MRISLLLSKDSGFTTNYVVNATRCLFVFGSGKQNIEWIHIDDASKFVYYAVNQSITGAYNLATRAKMDTIRIHEVQLKEK